jgi:Bacteriophage tail tube protein
VAQLTINTLWNVSVYLANDNLLGEMEEFEIPQPKRATMVYKSLGMAAQADIPIGWEKLEATFKWSSFDPNIFTNTVNSSGTPVSFTADAQVIQSSGLVRDIPVSGSLGGFFSDPGPLVLKAQANFENTSKYAVWHVDLSIGGVQVYLFDVFSNQLIVGGTDQLAAFRANVGGL